jgi:NAD(P)-dependent dehydrogenase (short-subunit alcohol dehydrogenase family)
MASVVFGGSSGIGSAVIDNMKKKSTSKIINVDLKRSDNTSISTNIVGNITLPGFRARVCSELSQFNELNCIIWTLRYREVKGESDVEILRKAFELEVISLLEIITLLSDQIIKSSTSIVVISSIASTLVSGQNLGYNLVKSTLESLVRSLAVEYGSKSNVRFNSISPGLLDIPLRSDLYRKNNPSAQHIERACIPRKQPINVSELAELIYFVSTPLSSCINGTNIIADGGESILDQHYVAERSFNQAAL